MQIGSLIRRAALYFGDAACLTEGARDVSFREFDRLTDVVGNALLARGLVPGERVGVLLPNSIECLVAYYALAKAGLVRVGLNTRETLENHRYKLADSVELFTLGGADTVRMRSTAAGTATAGSGPGTSRCRKKADACTCAGATRT